MYFIFIHPAIIYYSSVDYSDLADRNSSTAMLYLVTSILLWTGILILALYTIYRYSFKARRNIRYISKHGQKIEAQIIECNTLGTLSDSFERKSVVLEFENLRGATVWHKMEINDSKPTQKRFETGNKISLWIDKTFEKYPYIILDGIQTRINYGLYLAWLLFTFLIAGYFLYAYSFESHGYGWNFLEIGHPLIISPLVIYFIIFLGWLIFFKLIGKAGNGFIVSKDYLKLKCAGLQATAKILKTEQTGTYINENPQFRFTLEYVDASGKTNQVELTKIVPFIELHTVQHKERGIFYLPENPDHVAFVEDINSIA
ncbi:hypothetical protein [Chryseobacterium sp. SORGH_AS_1175]|uniref:hypothetical protein n=1 Tax=Chryseobacterium sp. SORGH_AS_1175 TaxID=3041760 RepID=UPI00286ACDDB|nr:hypothetical protein [Chryseobacterium sp. SORGH_AS_1175]